MSNNINDIQSAEFFLVSTPIGNLKDITFRAIEVLTNSDIILCEDTRKTIILLNHYEIKKKLISYNDHNKFEIIPQVLRSIEEGKKISLVSDAGTPVISDPGYHLIQELIVKGIRVIPIPGASSVIAAVSAAGLPADNFLFIGFLPNNETKIAGILNELKDSGITIIAFESAKRLKETIAIIADIFGNETKIVIARELTKLYEEFIRSTAQEILKSNSYNFIGEITLLFSNKEILNKSKNVVDRKLIKLYNKMLNEGVSKNSALKIIADTFGLKKNFLYEIVT